MWSIGKGGKSSCALVLYWKRAKSSHFTTTYSLKNVRWKLISLSKSKRKLSVVAYKDHGKIHFANSNHLFDSQPFKENSNTKI